MRVAKPDGWSERRMSREDYCSEVRQVLEGMAEHAARQISACLDKVPAEAVAVSFDLFPDQDGEGLLNVRISLEGPNLAVLQRAIEEHSAIVSTTIGKAGLEPPFPLMDPFEDLGFSVQDALVDEAAAWLLELCAKLPPSTIAAPAFIRSPEGYGSNLPPQIAST